MPTTNSMCGEEYVFDVVNKSKTQMHRAQLRVSERPLGGNANVPLTKK